MSNLKTAWTIYVNIKVVSLGNLVSVISLPFWTGQDMTYTIVSQSLLFPLKREEMFVYIEGTLKTFVINFQ